MERLGGGSAVRAPELVAAGAVAGAEVEVAAGGDALRIVHGMGAIGPRLNAVDHGKGGGVVARTGTAAAMSSASASRAERRIGLADMYGTPYL